MMGTDDKCIDCGADAIQDGQTHCAPVTRPALNGTDLPLDLEHVPADYAEAVEMLRRAKARIEALEIDNAALEDLLSGEVSA